MKPRLFTLIFFISISTIISSCKEFIEPSITGKQVQLKAPGSGSQISNYSLNFWWEEVDDALNYRLQVVTSEFDSVGSLMADTLVKGNKFQLTLDPGNYEWRVRAENGSSQTAYSKPWSFIIIPSSLTGQTVNLISPSNNSISSQNSVAFKWNTLFGATKYQIQIDTNNFENEASVIYDQIIPGQQLNFRLPADQTYEWRVRGANETEQSKWSAISYVTYDKTPPPQVILLLPSTNTTLPSPVLLKWVKVDKAVSYKLFIYKSDSVTLYNNTFPTSVNSDNYTFNSGNSGEKLYWKIIAIDAAGNESKDSELRNFTVQ